MKRLKLLTLCSILLSIGVFMLKRITPTTIVEEEGQVVDKEWLVAKKDRLTPKKDIRSGYYTFLSYPEWYLVFCPEEQANYFKKQTSSSFPYMGQTAQIWESYKIVNDQVKDNFKIESSYHLMIWVIGVSSSVEYGIKEWYETVVGRVTDTKDVITDEDKFTAQYTQEYVDFIKDRPWYEFDFKEQLNNLWSSTSFFGDHMLRKWERKYFLTSELLVKYAYGKLIGMGSQSIYGETKVTTAVVLKKGRKSIKPVKIEQEFPNRSKLVYLPRYDKFGPAITELAVKGCEFEEIAGQNSAILLTILVPKKYYVNFKNTEILFTQPIPSDKEMKRIALVIQVTNLHQLLRRLDREKIKIEHVFDY